MKVLMFLILFFLIGAFFIISNEDIRMNNQENITLFFSEYGQWFDSLFSNGKTAVGYAVKMEWLPGEAE